MILILKLLKASLLLWLLCFKYQNNDEAYMPQAHFLILFMSYKAFLKNWTIEEIGILAEHSSSVQFNSVTQLCPTLSNPMDCSTPGVPVHHQPQSLLKLMPTELVMASNHLIFYCTLLFLPSTIPSMRVFSNESALPIRWPKYWSFSFSIGPSNEYSGLISFGMDWLDLLAVQGTLKSLLQHHSSKASILQHSAFFIVQFSHPHMTIGKNIALTRWTFVGKAMSLLFNVLSQLVIAFLPRSKCLLISWLQSPSAVILEPPKIKFITVSTVFLSFAMKWWDQMPWP